MICSQASKFFTVMADGNDKAVARLDEIRKLFTGHEGPVRAVRFNRDGNYCMTCGSDKTLRLLNPHKGTLLKTYMGHGYEVLDAVAATENDKLASCSADKTVVLWDVATGKSIRKFRGHLSRVNCIRADQPDFSVLISGSYDATIRCWDTRSRSQEPLQIFDEAKDSVSSLQVSEHFVLSGSVDGFVRKYDLRLGKLTEDCIGEPVTSVSFTSDGQCILASSLDDTVRLIDCFSGEMLNSFKGHQNSKYKIDSCMSHDDKKVLCGSEDGSIYIWDLIDADIIQKIDNCHKGVAYSLSVHPQRYCLLSAGSDYVKLWGYADDIDE